MTADASVVFLTINDVYALHADDDGRGGIAELATLLRHARASSPASTQVIVTLNGDFLWRSELDRKDKGALMIDVLNCLDIDFVVLGNHEFDFGEHTLEQLLQRATFTTFGSNVRLRDTGALLQYTADTRIVTLANGLQLGLFGVCTAVTETISFASPNVAFESEVVHAKRCVETLKSQGADVIVALTHVRLAADTLIAKNVPEIDLILGGHDHEPMTLFQGCTLIHKSGQDAHWLGSVQLTIRPIDNSDDRTRRHVAVAHDWRMLLNRGYEPDQDCAQLLQDYAERVERECSSHTSDNETLAIASTPLDATRLTCRSRESNVCNIVADAMREELDADVAVVNGGYIRAERFFSAGTKITRAWLSQVLSYPNSVCLIEMRVADLRDALLLHWAAYPDQNAAFLHISGVVAVCDIRDRAHRSLRLFRDASRTHELALDTLVRVATSSFVRVATSSFVRAEMAGFQTGTLLVANGRIVHDVVANFLERRRQIAHPLQEHRIVVLE